MKAWAILILLLLAAGGIAQAGETSALDRTPVTATTIAGDRVLLYPNGRWEFADAKKAEAAKKQAELYPENQMRPVEAQGGLMGVGRVIMPGDKDYNRGSLNPKMR